MIDPVKAYALAVVNGHIIAGPYVRGACRRHLKDLERAVAGPAAAGPGDIWFDRDVIAKVFSFFEDTLKLSEGQFEGRPFKLHISQAFIIGSLFGWLRKNDQGLTVRRFRRAYIEMGKGNGKDLDVRTPIPTPDGWRVMGELRPGDRVFDEAHRPCTVTAVSRLMWNVCYKLVFSDGAEIIAGEGHLWRTSEGLITTRQIAATVDLVHRVDLDRVIISCEQTHTEPTRCISVDSPSRMFLCGRSMIPTHNSPLAGGIGIYGMMDDDEPGAQIYSAGATFDQASILFNDAVKMAQQSEEIFERVVLTGNAKVLNMNAPHYPQNNSFFRPLSREKGKTGSGPRPHFALVDELHEHPDGSVMDMLERGFKFRRQPLLLMITNSGSDRKTVCWEEHEHAAVVALGDKEDDALFSYVCALDVQQSGKNKGKPEDPLVDPSCWIKANPLLGVTITEEYLRGVVKQARDLPGKANGILRLHFCVWTDSATAWVTREMWESLEDASMRMEQFKGRQCWLACDLSQTRDMTATAVVFEDGFKDVPDPSDENKIARKPCYALFVYTYTPAETLATRQHNDRAPYDVWVANAEAEGKAFGLTALPGSVIRYDYVAQDVIDISREHKVQGLAYDNYLVRTFVNEFEELGMPAAESTLNMIDHPQGLSRRSTTDVWMPGSIDAFETLILERRLRVSVNPVLRAAVAGATFYKGPTELKRFDKAKATNRIDACVASAMALGIATQRDVELTSVYDRLAAARAADPNAAAVPAASVYDKLVTAGDIDYNILNNPQHPQHATMLERFYRQQAEEDELEGL